MWYAGKIGNTFGQRIIIDIIISDGNMLLKTTVISNEERNLIIPAMAILYEV
jgi:hypothetical protein